MYAQGTRSDRNSLWVRIRANIGRFFSKVKRAAAQDNLNVAHRNACLVGDDPGNHSVAAGADSAGRSGKRIGKSVAVILVAPINASEVLLDHDLE